MSASVHLLGRSHAFPRRGQEAEAVQSDPDAAVQLLVVRQLEGFAKAGKRVAPGEKEVHGGSGGFTGTPPGLFLRASVRILVGARGVFCVPSHPRGPPLPWLRAAALS